MASEASQIHFVLFPMMAQGHMIPMIDIARLLAQHGAIVSIVTTPRNAARFADVLARVMKSGLQIQVIELQFPSEKTGLPEGCENLDTLPSLGRANSVLAAASLLQQPVEQLFEKLTPRPSCIISDWCHPWTLDIAMKYGIPRISFTGFCCFSMLCLHKINDSKVLDSITSDAEYFVVPDLPDIKLTKGQLPSAPNMEEFEARVQAAEPHIYGIIMNTFEEMERPFLEEYKKATGKKVWCIGPVSLCNKDTSDKVQRGNKPTIDVDECLLKWLDLWQPGSVVYVCLGSLCNLILPQLIELGMGLEAADQPFIWAIREGDNLKEAEKWMLESGFEERVKGRGLIIKGWAPQVLILSHPAIGGFLTHCGWNSTLESICAGVPMLTWPLFAEQFCNERFVVQILKIGVQVGVEIYESWGEEEQLGVLVKKEDVVRAVDELMKGEEREERKKRAREIAKQARKALEEEGSSYVNTELLIEDIRQKVLFQEPT